MKFLSRTNVMLYTLYLMIIASLSACGGSDQSKNELLDDDGPLAELNQARALWQSYGITHYYLEVSRSCFCLPVDGDIYVIVEGDELNVIKDGGEPVDDSDFAKSIEDYFDRIEQVIQSPNGSAVVQYNAEFGYPETISLDPNEGAVDDEVYYELELHSHYQLKQDIAANKSKWQSLELNHYQMEFSYSCFCSPINGDMLITVDNGTVTSATDSNGGMVDLNELANIPVTVEQWFAQLENHANSADAEISVSFSAQGYPTQISINPGLFILDSSISATISNLE